MTILSLLTLSPMKIARLCLCVAGLLTLANSDTIAQFWKNPFNHTQPRQLHAPQHPNTQQLPQQPSPQLQANPQLQQQPSTQTQAPNASQNTSPAFNPNALALSDKDFDFKRDWWKYTIMLVAAAVCAFYLMKVGTQLLRFLGLLLCFAFSIFIAYLAGPAVEPLLATHAPWLNMPQCPVLYWAYFIVFLTAYIVATLILGVIKRPFDLTAGKKHNKAADKS